MKKERKLFQKKKNKPKKTYAELHNAAVIKFRRYAKIMIWVGILNFLSPLIGLIQGQAGVIKNISEMPYYFCMSSNQLAALLIGGATDIPNWVYILIVLAITGLTSAGLILLGVYAPQGKRKFLYAEFITYIVDWLFIPVIYLTTGLSQQCWLAMIYHGGITIILFLAVHYYREVIDIEKRFTNKEGASEEETSEEVQNNGN